MAVRDRVQRAIEAPTAEAQKLLAETPHADPYERLSVLVSGWFRGLAAALEELAVEIDAMREQSHVAVVYETRPPFASGEAKDDVHGHSEPAPRVESGEGAGEAVLADRARASRAETRALREERGE